MEHLVSQQVHTLPRKLLADPKMITLEECRNTVFKAGCVPNMCPPNKLGKQ